MKTDGNNVWSTMLTLIILLNLPRTSFAQTSSLNLEVTRLSDYAYVLTRTWKPSAQRTNMGMIIGKNGLVLINALYRNDELPMFEKALKKLSDKPVQYVINSNWDAYNTWSNQYFKNKGAIIIAHKNLSYHDNFNADITFSDSYNLDIGTETIIAYRSYGHSFGHVNIYLKQANAAFMSDSYRSEWMTIEGPYGLDGHIKGLDMALNMGNDSTQYISGNTRSKLLSNKEDLLKEKQLRSAFAYSVLFLKGEGKSASEILADDEIVAVCKQYELYNDLVANGEVGNWIINPILFVEQAKTHVFSGEQLEQYVGNYQMKDKNDTEIFIENGVLYAKSKGQFYVKLVPVSATKFWYDMQNLNAYFTFNFNDINEVISFSVQLHQDTLNYEKQ